MSGNDAPVYVAARSRNGRRWLVVHENAGLVRLQPLGDDVRNARSATTGKWQGGVRAIIVTREALDDPKRWRRAAADLAERDPGA